MSSLRTAKLVKTICIAVLEQIDAWEFFSIELGFLVFNDLMTYSSILSWRKLRLRPFISFIWLLLCVCLLKIYSPRSGWYTFFKQ